ncbi:MAG: hypothetical protein ABFD25_09440 [Clostridiaceae bacterium]
MNYIKSKTLEEIFNEMDDYDLCQVVNKNFSYYTPEALEIALSEYKKRKQINPKIEEISLRQERKRIIQAKKGRKEEARRFFYRHILHRLIMLLVLFILFLVYITKQ